jgi:tetratricopeptide (TPR) repeat protein
MAWLLLVAVLSQAAPSADDLVKKLDASPDLKGRDKPFEISVSLARLYFGQGRYREAASFYEQAVAKAAPTKALYLQFRKQTAPVNVAGCEIAPGNEMGVLTDKALAKQKAKDLAGAAGCARNAVQGLLEAEVQLGHSQFLSGDPAAALATYTKSLESFEQNVDARYSRGALLLDWRGDDVASLNLAKADFETFLREAPKSPKAREASLFLERTIAAIAAGGASKLAPPPVVVRAPVAVADQPPVLSKEVMEAFQNAPRTPELQEKFAKALDDAEASLAKGQFLAALDGYKTVMPYQPENPRVRAGMAWSLFKLGKPMAERVWGVATQDPEAVAKLGDALKKQGNEEEAKAVWQRLAQSVPAFAPNLENRK